MRKTLVAILLIVGAAVLGLAAFLSSRAGRGAPAVATSAQASVSATDAVASRSKGQADSAAADPSAADKPTARHEPAVVKAAPVWVVDKAASRLSFRGVMNGEPFDGVFRDWDAQIAFDPKTLSTSRASITVETESALTGQPIKDAALPNSEWLSVQQFPQATLVTRSIRQVAPGRFEAAADVHIRGVRWRTIVPFAVSITHDQGRMTSTLAVDRRTFGIGEGPFQSPPPVEPMVQVTMKLVAKKSR